MKIYLRKEDIVHPDSQGDPELEDRLHLCYFPGIEDVIFVHSERGADWSISNTLKFDIESSTTIDAEDLPFKDKLLESIFESEWIT
jgi:hypothetical protein